MDIIAIGGTQRRFYESLGNLKGRGHDGGCFGFKGHQHRGFNSTSPVRSLQLIDGVDNQSPGLNFSLGSFLGQRPGRDEGGRDRRGQHGLLRSGAFNGVIAMTTKSPWLFPG